MNATVRTALRKTLLFVGGFAAGGLLGLLLTLVLPHGDDQPRGSQAQAEVDRQAVAAAVLVERHGCWIGAQDMPADMAGVIPGHVIAARGARPPVYSAELVGPALDSLFGVKPHPRLLVFAFCR